MRLAEWGEEAALHPNREIDPALDTHWGPCGYELSPLGMGSVTLGISVLDALLPGDWLA